MKNIAHKFINLDARDFHMHTTNFSDGLNTIHEMVQFSGEIGLQHICITDHSDAIQEKFRKAGFFPPTARWSLRNWKNYYNNVKVQFGVEGDLLNEAGDVCFEIQGRSSDFIILSAHRDIYTSNPETVTRGTIHAIERYHEYIAFVGHPDNNSDFGEYYNVDELVEACNSYGVPVEFNAKNLLLGKSNIEKTHYILQHANSLYLNSDAHNFYELQEARPYAVKFLYENEYISSEERDTFISQFTFKTYGE